MSHSLFTLSGTSILDDEWQYTSFYPTPKMSTYLFAFAVSEFTSTPSIHEHVKIHVCAFVVQIPFDPLYINCVYISLSVNVNYWLEITVQIASVRSKYTTKRIINCIILVFSYLFDLGSFICVLICMPSVVCLLWYVFYTYRHLLVLKPL